MRRSRTAVALVVCIATALAAGTTFASAASGAREGGADTYNVAPGTVVNATNSGNAVFSATDPTFGTITITCTVATFTGRTGNTLKIHIAPPVFADAAAPPCTDNFGFTNTYTSSGTWSVKEKDTGKDEGLPEPNATGDTMIITIPTAGLVDVNSSAPGCTITFAPGAPANVTGTYNDAGTLTITNASIPISTSGCPVTPTTATLTVTYTLGPAIFDIG